MYEPGSPEAFDRLYRDNYPRLVRVLYAVLGDAAAAEDCVQEAFLRAYRAWGSFRPEKPPAAWIHQIALNTALSYRRKQKLREVGEVLRRFGRPAPVPDPADQAGRSDLLRALSAQPPRMTAAFVMRHYHGYTNRELAAVFGVSERSIGEWLARVKADLRVRLGESWNAAPLPTSVSPGVEVLVADES